MKEGSEPHLAALLDALRNVLCNLADPRSVLKEILQQAVQLTQADRGLLVEIAHGREVDHRVLLGITSENHDGPAGDFSRHLLQRVLDSGDDVLLRSASDDPYFKTSTSMQAIGTAAVLCVPVRGDGRIAAIIYLEKKKAGGFDDSHRRTLRVLADFSGRVLESIRAANEQQTLAAELRRVEDEQRAELKQDWAFGRFLGRSPAVRELEPILRKVAGREVSVLLLGETGTGKSILARAIHFEGPRAGKAFVTVSCPNLEKGLIESELFGHKRGSFTNAVADRVGKVQAADGGTLFLDEIGELPLETQGKFLRLLEEGTYEIVGESRERTANIRIIAATNRNLAADVASGRFREDLLARLDVVSIHVPPLRERKEDIGLLLRDCLDRENGGRWITLSPEAIAWLEGLSHLWPRNVRDLRRIAVLLTMQSHDGPVSAATIARLLDGPNGTSPGKAGKVRLEDGLPALLAEAECEWLREAIDRYPDATREELAKILKISASTLYKRIADCGLGKE